MKKLKSTPNSFSPTLPIDKKWLNPKEGSLTKDAERSSSSKRKYVRETTNLLLLSMKKVSTQSAWKPSPIKKLLLSEGPREEIWKESFSLVVELPSTLLNN